MSERRPVDKVRDRLAARLPSAVKVLGVDDGGIDFLLRGPDRVLDVLFDGRRIWSFWARRDTVGAPSSLAKQRAAWPDRMKPFLDGATQLSIVEHVSEDVLLDESRTFGSGNGRVEFVNKMGLEISLDKSGRFSPTFDVRSGEHIEPLLDAMQTVIDAVADLDVVAFPGWGTLLGAVREQSFLGHDSDADLTYLSSATTPVDVALESYALQRLLCQRGFNTYRYSGAAFRIDVVESDGVVRGLDLFAGFYDNGRLYVMGEVGRDFEREWLWPLSTCQIADRTFAAPARPDKMLEAMYGPGWLVPDPAFKFSTPADVHARLNDWFRGMATFRQGWEREYSAGGKPGKGSSSLARLVHAEAPADATILDVGTGRGRDALWLSRQDRAVIGYDYAPRGYRSASRIAARQELTDLELRVLNLTDLRSVFGEGARLSRISGQRTIMARHVLDATTATGRDNFGRFASIALRGGGRLYADVWLDGPPPLFGLRRTSIDQVVCAVEAGGGTVVSTATVPGDADLGGADVSVGRVIAEWT